MPNPESAPAFQQPEVVEKKRTMRERFVTVPTHLPGVSLRAEPSVEVDILRKTIEELAFLAKGYAERKFQIDKLSAKQKDPDREIKTLAQTHEGLRGVQSEEDNFVLSVYPKDSVTLDRKLLKKSLGAAYFSLVHEDLGVNILVPTELKTEEGLDGEEFLRQVLTQALIKLGLEESDLPKIMKMSVAQRVDEETLEKMIEGGQVTLLEGTKQIDRTWAITVAPLRKSPVN